MAHKTRDQLYPNRLQHAPFPESTKERADGTKEIDTDNG